LNAVEVDLSSDIQFGALKGFILDSNYKGSTDIFLGAPAEKNGEAMKTKRRYSTKYCMATGELQHPYPAVARL
jgi:hypothetical protein